jgi:epoxide hydrolase-like predicted phosphatase
MIKLIIFDMGGVVIKFNEHDYYRYLSRKIGISEASLKKAMLPPLIRMETGQLKFAGFTRIVCKSLRIPKYDLEWNLSFERLGATNIEVTALIRKLRKRYKIALLSNISETRYVVALENFVDRTLFDKMFPSYAIGLRKPDRRLYLHVLKCFHVKPEEAIFIDNLKENVKGARSVGIKSIQFLSYEKLEKDLEKMKILRIQRANYRSGKGIRKR